MQWLLGSILTTSWLALCFIFFKKRNIPLLPAITVNYAVCTICGYLYNPNLLTSLLKFPSKAIGLGTLQGFLFIFMFFQIGRSTQVLGVAYTTMIGRLSVVLPTLFSILVYNEPLSSMQGVGLVLALSAIYFMNKPDETSPLNLESILKQGAILFLGNGLIDCIFKIYNQNFSFLANDVFSTWIFFIAGIIGLIVMLLKRVSWSWTYLMAGLVLGVPNFFSLIFMLKALETMPGTQFFPLNNIGIILCLSLVGYVFLGERTNIFRYIGLIITILAIILLSGVLKF